MRATCFGIGLSLLLVGCQQDAYRIRSVGDGSVFDGPAITELGPTGDGDGSKRPADRSVERGRDLTYDACRAMHEVCNNFDDNCDGQIDEGFDKLSDARYCEGCKGCSWLLGKNAYPACDKGTCKIATCKAGFADVNQDAGDGCEYPCIATGVEVCDGEDNDCNGKIDDGLPPPASICKDKGACQGSVAVCAGKVGWQCNYSSAKGVELQPCSQDSDCGPGNTCDKGSNVCPNMVAYQEAKCDGIDGDCDGGADEPFTNKGQPCGEKGKQGICAGEGSYICDSSGTSTICSITKPGQSPRDEECNGLDDDCDGQVDEETDDAAGKGVVDAMVHVNRTVGGTPYNFYIYAYEASRPDAGQASPGAQTTRACSRAGVLPWAAVTYPEAAAACAASGKRLCSAAEWTVACEGAARALYPYGGTYSSTSCNGFDQATAGAVPTGSMASCQGGESGLYDMSGNLREWTSEQQGKTDPPQSLPIYVVRGGAYHTPAIGLSCSFGLSLAVQNVALPAVGFRCCSSTAP